MTATLTALFAVHAVAFGALLILSRRDVVVVSTVETSRRIEGWNSTSSNAWRARASESSPSAAPSV